MMASVDRNIVQFGRGHGGKTSLSSCDDCSDGLAVERTGQIALFQTIDDLDRTTVLCGLHQLEHGSLDDNIAEVHILQLLDRYLRHELGIPALLRSGRLEPV